MQPAMGMDGALANLGVDQAQYMAPMDLYDSIWGGECPPPLAPRAGAARLTRQNRRTRGTRAASTP